MATLARQNDGEIYRANRARRAPSRLGIVGAKENEADFPVLRELIESGKLTPAVDRTFPLNEVPEAIRYLKEGNAHGKVVIAV